MEIDEVRDLFGGQRDQEGLRAMSQEDIARRLGARQSARGAEYMRGQAAIGNMMSAAHTEWLRNGMDEIQLPAKKPTLMQRVAKLVKIWWMGWDDTDYASATGKAADNQKRD